MHNIFIEQPSCGWRKSRFCGSLNSQLRGWLKCLMCNFWPANLWLKEEPIVLLFEQPIVGLTEMLNIFIEQPSCGWRKSRFCGSLNSQLRPWVKCLMCNYWPANLWLKEEPIVLLIEQPIAWLTEMLNIFIEQPSCGWRKSQFCGSLNSQLRGWLECLMYNYWTANLRLTEEPIVWLIDQPIAWLTEMLNV